MKATFCPDKGMNLTSLMFDDIEVIDQSTRNLFEERNAGLGALIGPHFYHRKNPPRVPNPSAFPHISRLKSPGSDEPFSHGIGRYVSWNYTASNKAISGHLSGKDTYGGMPLSALEGFDFEMNFNAQATANGLEVEMNVESPTAPTIAGLHYYYALDNHAGVVRMSSQDQYNDMGTLKPIPPEWKDPENGALAFNLKWASDYGFRPRTQDFSGDAELATGTRRLHIHYQAGSDEQALQLYHPLGASFVCIEPVTAKNPRDAKQRKNHLKVRIQSL